MVAPLETTCPRDGCSAPGPSAASAPRDSFAAAQWGQSRPMVALCSYRLALWSLSSISIAALSETVCAKDRRSSI